MTSLPGGSGFGFDHGLGGEFFLRHIVAVLAECALGELHDVALVHKGHARKVLGEGVADGGADKALGAFFGHGLDAHGGGGVHIGSQFVAQEGDELGGFGRPGLVFDARVDVFGVFAEDDHVHALGMLDRGLDAFKVADGPDAGVEVEGLAQGDVEAAETRAHRRAEGALDGELGAAQGGEGFVGQERPGFLERLFAREQFLPVETALVAVAQTDGFINDGARAFPHVRADAVAFNPVNSLAHGERLQKCYVARATVDVRVPRGVGRNYSPEAGLSKRLQLSASLRCGAGRGKASMSCGAIHWQAVASASSSGTGHPLGLPSSLSW